MNVLRLVRKLSPCLPVQDGQSQFEINWKYDDCLRTADKHVFFKFMVKSVAEQHGKSPTCPLGQQLKFNCASGPDLINHFANEHVTHLLWIDSGFQATFMPKPFRHQTGNGCHTHISVWDHNNSTHDETCSTNLFHDPEKELVSNNS